MCANSLTFSDLVNILKEFGIALGFGINWDTNITYWCEKGVITPLVWFKSLRWNWPKEKILSKLLGISFGLNLDVVDVKSFLIEKIKKQLSYWCFVHLSLVGRTIIITLVLTYSL
jgi:hypothetical protein